MVMAGRCHGLQTLIPIHLRLALSRRGGLPPPPFAGKMFPFRPSLLAARALPDREIPCASSQKV